MTLGDEARVSQGYPGTLNQENEAQANQGCQDTVTLADEARANHGCPDTMTVADGGSVQQGRPNILTPADDERTRQGIYELEISFNGECDLEKQYHRCTKNPGHLRFEPVHNFDLRHLPKKFRCFETLQFIRHLARLTVKISVNFISSERPSKFPCSKYAGQRALIVGSGCVTDVLDNEDIRRLPCPFEDCMEAPEEHSVFGYITVVTAAHVVCDDAEASNTTVEFFDDDADCKTHVMIARGVKVGAVSVDGDFCELLCVLHDTIVLETIRKNLSKDRDFVMMRPGKASPVVSSLFMDDKKLKRDVLDVPVCHVVGLSGDKVISTCPFKNCSEMPGEHEVYGYICVLIEADIHGDDDIEADQLTVEVINGKPGLGRDKWTMKGAHFRPTSMQGCSQQLLCVIHEREVFDSLKHVLLGNKQIYLYNRFTNYYDIVCDIFKDRLHIERSSSFQDRTINLCVNIKYGSQECVDTLMALLTYTIPRIEEAVYKHHCSNTCFVDQLPCPQPIAGNNRRTVETAALHLAGIRRYLERDTSGTLEHFKGTIRRELEKLLSQDAVDRCSLNHCFDSEVMEASCLDPGEAGINSLIVMRINSTELSICVEFHDHISSHDRYESFRVSAHITDDEAASDNEEKVSGDDDDDYYSDTDDDDEDDMLLIHISHSHGQSKHISLGKQTQCHTGDGFYHSLYTVPTCPGSSGGPVWMIPASGDLGKVSGVPHSGCHGNELSQGSSWTLYPL